MSFPAPLRYKGLAYKQRHHLFYYHERLRSDCDNYYVNIIRTKRLNILAFRPGIACGEFLLVWLVVPEVSAFKYANSSALYWDLNLFEYDLHFNRIASNGELM